MKKSAILKGIFLVSFVLVYTSVYTSYWLFVNSDELHQAIRTQRAGGMLPCAADDMYDTMRKDLIDICHRFNKANVSYWLDDGLLLGIIRENRILKHDTDIDIGYMFNDLDAVKLVFESPYHYGRYADFNRYQLFLNRYVIRKCEYAELLWYKLNIVKTALRLAPYTWFFPTQRLGGDSEFSHCQIPAETHKLLENKFGSAYLEHVPCNANKTFKAGTKSDRAAFC